MDDLTDLKGIGKVGAAALQAAGLETFAAIAAADPDARPEGLSASLNWADVIAEARDLSQDTQGQSGTAREAPSTDGGTAAGETSSDVGTQSAAPISQAGAVADQADAQIKAQADAQDGEAVADFILVTGPRRGRWRGGMYFTATPVLLVLADLTDDQKELIDGDKTLNVVELTASDVEAMQGEGK